MSRVVSRADIRHARTKRTTDGVIDPGGGKTANGNEAIASGLCHFVGLPRVELDGDRATATSYLQIITPHKGAAPMEVSGHGASSGFRIHRIGANRWELKRTEDGWKVTRRPLDGSEGARLTSATNCC